MSNFTSILQSIDAGDPQAAEELLLLVYEELRRLAQARMASQPPGQTIQPTELVHEAWVKLSGDQDASWRDRKHFYFTAAKAMRQILIDRARRKQRVRHGGDVQRVDIGKIEIAEVCASDENTHLELNDAIDALEQQDEIKAQIVQLKFFIGLTEQEIADQLGISERTVKRHWAYAKAWLFERIGKSSEG